MYQIQVEQARNSVKALFPFRIVFIDCRLIGTHENIERKEEKELYNSFLTNGYDGPPISVFQRGSDVAFNTNSSNLLDDVQYGEFGLADGHHRFKAIYYLCENGLLKSNIIPVQLIPAHDAQVIKTATSFTDEKPLSIMQIENCFIESSLEIPYCSTHFQTKLSNGKWVKLQDSQPDIKIKKVDFIV